MNVHEHNGRLTDKQVGVLLILPGLAVFVAIILYPFVNAILMSFTNRSLLFPEYDWIQLENYRKVFADPYFTKTLVTTALFVLGSTIFPYTLGLLWAIVLNQGFKGAEFMRGVTLVNWIIPGTAIGFLWSWIFNGQYGILNNILQALGLLDTGIPWLGQTGTALLCVIIARTWQMLPWYMAFLLGGLQSVPKDQIEAAHVDGANNLITFGRVILPNMKQTALTVFILGLIGNLQHLVDLLGLQLSYPSKSILPHLRIGIWEKLRLSVLCGQFYWHASASSTCTVSTNLTKGEGR